MQVVSDTLPDQRDTGIDIDDVSRSNPEILVQKVVDILHLADVPLGFRQTGSPSQDL